MADVIKRTLESTPKDATHWSIRSMAAETGLSHTTIRRIGTAFGLQLHRSETFKLSTDPMFVDKVQDFVGLHLAPPNRAIVLWVMPEACFQHDVKSQIQALDRERLVLPMAPGVAERRTHNYIRNATTSLFAALDIATWAVIGKCYERHRATEFLDFLKKIDAAMLEGPDVHLVMDSEADQKTAWGAVFPLNATHKIPKIKAWQARRPHWHEHFTPTSARWINQVERWCAELTRKQLQRGVQGSTAELEADMAIFIEAHNEDPKPYRWVKSADEVVPALKRFCQWT